MHSKTVGVLIGRFQLPSLHGGHKALISHALKNSDKVCILVGVAPRPSLKNLLPYPVVEAMIRGEYSADYAEGRLQIHPLPDIDGNDLQWSMQIDKFLGMLYPADKIVLWSGRDSFKPSYYGRFRPVQDYFGYNGDVNGSNVRNAIMSGDAEDDEMFRKGIIYGLGNYLRKVETCLTPISCGGCSPRTESGS